MLVAAGMDVSAMFDEVRTVEQRALLYWTTGAATNFPARLARETTIIPDVLSSGR